MPDLGVKQLVKDGVWQVPPSERPRGWESMTVRERSEEITHTISTRETVITVQEPEPQELAVIEVDPAPISELKQIESAVKVVSHLPVDPPEAQEIVDATAKLYDLDMDDKEWDAVNDQFQDRIYEAAKIVNRHRRTKVVTDEALSQWLHKHRDKIRHMGAGSEPIKDLWRLVHGLLMQSEMAAEASWRKQLK